MYLPIDSMQKLLAEQVEPSGLTAPLAVTTTQYSAPLDNKQTELDVVQVVKLRGSFRSVNIFSTPESAAKKART
jgi:hypothetical protein